VIVQSVKDSVLAIERILMLVICRLERSEKVSAVISYLFQAQTFYVSDTFDSVYIVLPVYP
jgi:hypothetical protein